MADNEQFEALIHRARNNDLQALQELNEMLAPGIKRLLSRSFDSVHADALAAAILTSLAGEIRANNVSGTKSCLAFVRARIRERAFSLNPKPSTRVPRPGALPPQLSAGMSRKDREIIVRHYTLVQDERRISTEMGLTEESVRAALAEARRRYRGPVRASKEPEPPRRTSRAC